MSILIEKQVFYGGSSHWAGCLQKAAPYMQSLIDMTVSGEKQDTPTGGFLSDGVSHLRLTAAKALLGKLVWFEVLATVSTGTGPFLGIEHKLLLNSNNVDMIKTSGRHNAVVIALGEIATLYNWKKHTESEKRLSMIELVTRGGTIVESLNSLISSLFDAKTAAMPATSTQNLNSPKRLTNKSPEELARDVTIVYARAALVFLHFVLSGFNPHVEEIRRATIGLIESLKILCGSRMIGYALWPLCVAACAVQDEDEERCLFQFMEFKEQDPRHAHLQTYHAVRAIGRECRKSAFIDGERSCWM